MSVFVMRIIIRRGTFAVTDTFTLTGRRRLSRCFIGGSIAMRWCRVCSRRRVRVITRGWVWVMRLSLRWYRPERLSMRTIEHRRRILTIGSRPIAVARLRSTVVGAIGSIQSRGRNKGGLGRDWVEETLLVEAHTILAPAIRRIVVARASDLPLSAIFTRYGCALTRCRHLLRWWVWVWIGRRWIRQIDPMGIGM